jgi:hypothetical protein
MVVLCRPTFRAFSARRLLTYTPWAAGPGCYISRFWR